MKKLLFPILILIFFGCNKPPVANFKINLEDSEEVDIGDTVKITNTSQKASSYLWELPDGEILTSKDIIYIPASSGTKKIKLTAISKNGKQEDTITNSLKVKPELGAVIFYLSDKSPVSSTIVYFLETNKNIPTTLSVAPDCENWTGGALFKDISGGNYNYLAGNSSKSWNGSITVEEGKCHVIKFE